MNRTLLRVSLAGSFCVVLCSTGCSGGGGTAPLDTPQTPQGTAATRAMRADPSGLPPPLLSRLQLLPPDAAQTVVNRAGGKTKVLAYVADFRGPVEILSGKSYQDVGSISSGVKQAGGTWVDASGNVYVASYGAKHVTEYAPGGSSPICTYSQGLADPVNVTTDGKGNVYVVDYNLGAAGSIDVYPQCSNTISTQYSINGGPEGAALDTSGDLFVSYNATGQGALEEFIAGSTSPTPIAVPIQFGGGAIVDGSGNLLVCDQLAGTVDQIPPPYTAITLQFSGFANPFNVSLTKDGRRLLLADPGRRNVVVLAYPSGLRLAELGRGNGLGVPVGVAASPDVVL